MSEPLIALNNVSKHFGGVRALHDVSFDVPREGVLGLIGPNGAGKTTAFSIMSGHVHADSGRVIFDGADIGRSRPSALARLGMARSWQHVRLLPELTVLDNVLVGVRMPHAERPFSRLVRWRTASEEERQGRERAAQQLRDVGVDVADFHRPAHGLSFGEQKVVALARLLVGDPRVILLDEPASGMDAPGLTRLLEVVREIADRGIPVVLVEHNLSVVTQIADHAVVLSNGCVVAEGAPGDLVRRQDLIDLYVGTQGSTP